MAKEGIRVFKAQIWMIGPSEAGLGDERASAIVPSCKARSYLQAANAYSRRALDGLPILEIVINHETIAACLQRKPGKCHWFSWLDSLELRLKESRGKEEKEVGQIRKPGPRWLLGLILESHWGYPQLELRTLGQPPCWGMTLTSSQTVEGWFSSLAWISWFINIQLMHGKSWAVIPVRLEHFGS